MTDARTASVSFACQRCLQPLQLEDSFGHMSEYALAELDLPIYANAPTTGPHASTSAATGATATATTMAKATAAPAIDHFVPPFRLTDSDTAGTAGFMLVSDGRPTAASLSATLRARTALFDALSANSAIDHPLCDECTDQLLDQMDRQLAGADAEWHEYNAYLQRLERQQLDAPDVDGLERELAELGAEEQRMCAELERLQQAEADVQRAIVAKTAERGRLDGEEERFRREYTRYRRELMLTEDDYRSLECQLGYARQRLERLRQTNVFNVTFHIWHAGHFGTINTFRLGRLPSQPVEWSEINAAWGQTALLLAALARKVGLTFKRYRLVPFGNHSYVEVLGEGGKELPLYGTGGFKFFWDTKFDAAMVAFLDCLTQFKEEVERGDSGFCLPYRMDKGKIEDSSTGNSYSIKIQFNSEEQWTKALKFLLTNLKWGLTWVSSQFSEDPEIEAPATADVPTEADSDPTASVTQA